MFCIELISKDLEKRNPEVAKILSELPSNELLAMEVMEKFMEKHAEVIAASGHKQETTVVKILSDS